MRVQIADGDSASRQGLRVRFETYRLEHPEAELSAGICPECLGRAPREFAA